MKTLSALFLMAFAGTALGQSTLVQDAVQVGAEQFVATSNVDAFSARGDLTGRTVTSGDLATISGGWYNGTSAFAFVSGQATGITTNFSGTAAQFGTTNTQLGATSFFSKVGFTGTTTGGNHFAQMNIFANSGPLDARTGFGINGIMMGGGRELFTGGTNNPVNVTVPSGKFIQLVAVEWGFFNAAGTFLGAFNLGPSFGGNLVTADTFGTGVQVTNLTTSGITATTAEMYLYWEYQIVPTPGAAALLGIAGLTGIRRRR